MTKNILEKISKDPAISDLLDSYYPLPKAFYLNRKHVKAIVLGCDPTNTKTKKRFTTVFGINDGDDRYFNPILNNLERVGLSKSKIYVQNLVRNYCSKETSENEVWDLFAEHWLPVIKREFDDFFNPGIPVFITAGKLYDFLVTSDESQGQGYDYCYKHLHLIPSEANKLNRTIIPFFRHNKYSLKNNYPKYRNLVSDFLQYAYLL